MHAVEKVIRDLNPNHVSAPEIQISSEDAGQDKPRSCDFTPIPTGTRGCFVFRRLSGKREVLQGGIVWLSSHIADDNHDDRGYQSDQDAEVLEIDIVDDPQERTMRISILKPAQAESYRRVHEHAEDAENETHNHGPERALRVHALEKHAQEKHHENRRS